MTLQFKLRNESFSCQYTLLIEEWLAAHKQFLMLVDDLTDDNDH